MLLKTSISSTKKFFKRTIQSFKSLLSNGYQKLPKTPPFNPFSCAEKNLSQSYREMDAFYADFTDHWDHNNEKAAGKRSKSKISISQRENETRYGNSMEEYAKVKRSESKILISQRETETRYENSMEEYAKAASTKEKKGIVGRERKRRGNIDEFSTSGGSKVVREEKVCLVTRKLKELEMMDVSNIEHVLDIEEVLHYYSRLTCPAYLDIVDKFFMEMYSELFNLKASTKF